MNEARREQLQISILTVLDANHSRYGLPVAAVALHVSSYGFAKITHEEVETELEYLAEKGLAQSVTKMLEPANRAWVRTATGRDYLSEHGAGS